MIKNSARTSQRILHDSRIHLFIRRGFKDVSANVLRIPVICAITYSIGNMYAHIRQTDFPFKHVLIQGILLPFSGF